MRNFLQIAQGVDVGPLMATLAAHPELWGQHPWRQFEGSPHAEVEDILLRFQAVGQSPNAMAAAQSDPITVPYGGWMAIPQARLICLGLMRGVEGVQLGRVMITRLAPGKSITPHTDAGIYAAMFQRYHLALQAGPGNVTFSGQEQITMAPGQVWWINNRESHGVVNNSEVDRLVMITDVRVD